MSSEALAVRVEAPSGLRAALVRFLDRPEAPAIVFLVALVGVFAITAKGFMTTGNVEQILDQAALVGTVALGVNLVIRAAEIDISVGSVLALSAMIAGAIAVEGGGFWLALGGAVGVGMCAGAVNGVLTTVGRIPSIIVTLGMLYAVRGLVLATETTGVTEIPEEARILGQGSIFGVSVTIVVLLVTFLVVELISRHVTWGRNVVAVGDNRQAARLAGLRVDAVRATCFVVAGLCTGIAAMMYVGQLGLVQPQAATGFELQVIAAIVIGGTRITGGYGSSLAPLVGAVLLGVILNGLNLLGVEERWENVFTGGLILLAVASDVLRRRVITRLETR